MSRGNARSRYQERSRRKKNMLLNTLIGIVLILIVIVGASIFLGDDKEEELAEEEIVSEEEALEEEELEKEEPASESENPIEVDIEESTPSVETSTEPDELEPEDENIEMTTPEHSSDDVIRTFVNPSWQPVGTVQEGEHYNVYDGVDWDEMVKAITYAIGHSEDDITIHFLGNNGHNKSVGTVYTKGKENIYRVYIEWVDEEGWKPTLVEELAEIPEEKAEEETEETTEVD